MQLMVLPSDTSEQQFQRHQTTLWVNIIIYNSMSRYQLNSSSQNKTHGVAAKSMMAGEAYQAAIG